MSSFRRRGGGSGVGEVNARKMTLTPCLGGSTAFSCRFDSARRAWPPAQLQVKHPSLGYLALITASRFSAISGAGVGRKGEGAAGGGGNDGKDDAVAKLIEKYGDAVGQVTFSGVLGFSSGQTAVRSVELQHMPTSNFLRRGMLRYAAIKVGKAVAFLIGVTFITLQGLNYAGVVSVKWNKLHDKAKDLLDTNKDKVIDKEDAKNLWKRLKTAFTQNLPAGGGFAGGFALGLCCG